MKRSILDAIGHTPLVEIKHVNPNPGVSILAKLEYFNPGGSIKDRAALYMIEAGEKSGELTRGKTVLEANLRSFDAGYDHVLRQIVERDAARTRSVVADHDGLPAVLGGGEGPRLAEAAGRRCGPPLLPERDPGEPGLGGAGERGDPRDEGDVKRGEPAGETLLRRIHHRHQAHLCSQHGGHADGYDAS